MLYLPSLYGLNSVSKSRSGKRMHKNEKTTFPNPAQNIKVCVETRLHFTGITLHIAPAKTKLNVIILLGVQKRFTPRRDRVKQDILVPVIANVNASPTPIQ